MSCPDWPSLADRRDRQPEVWDAALAHLDDCTRCRDAALDVEPTLLFRNLPAPAVGGGEIAAMKQAVAALRRNTHRATPPAWLRAAAVAAVLITAALLQGALRPGAGGEEVDVLAAYEVSAGGSLGAASLGAASLDLEQMPLVEYVDPIYGSVVEVVDDEMSLVLVLPPGPESRAAFNDV